jgi:hypothetical protein
VQRHGISRQVRRASSGSTPHDRTTIPQTASSRSPALDRPRQSALRHSAVVSNRPTNHSVRRHRPLNHEPIHRPPTCSIGSTPITHLIRGTQIPIAQPRHPRAPSRGFLPWRFADAGPVCAAPPPWGRHPKTFTKGDINSTFYLCVGSYCFAFDPADRTAF